MTQKLRIVILLLCFVAISYEQSRPSLANELQLPKKPCECQGESEWKLNYVITLSSGKSLPIDVNIRFQARRDENCNCKHYMRISTICSNYQVCYKTSHYLKPAWVCPAMTILAVQQPYTNLNSQECLNYPIWIRNQIHASMMDIANEFPAGENGGYCIEPFGAFNLLNMGGFGMFATKPQWMLGPKRIWFYPC